MALDKLNFFIYGDNWSNNASMQTRTIWYSKFNGNIQSRFISLEIRMSVKKAFDRIMGMLSENGYSITYNWFDAASFAIQNDKLLLSTRASIDWSRGGDSIAITNFKFEIFGSESTCDFITKQLADIFQDRSFTSISWFFREQGGIDSRTMYIDHKNNTLDEFYPWFHKGLNTFIDDYMDSSAAVLILYGPPGTGKTSFLKHMLCRRKTNAIVTYDELVLQDDRFFIDFLTNDDHEVMVVEDADLLLTSRESDHNVIMSKFLNVSDGLVKIANKKLVFTTNISQINKVDPALTRKGRCFGTVEFRKMTPDEARNAARAANLPEQDWYSKREWALAEIFNQDTDDIVEQTSTRKVGFV